MSHEYTPYAESSSSSTTASSPGLSMSDTSKSKSMQSSEDFLPFVKHHGRKVTNSLKSQLASIRTHGNLWMQFFIIEHTLSNFLIPLLLLDNSEAHGVLFYFIVNCIGVQCIYATSGHSKAMMLPFFSLIFRLLGLLTANWRVYNFENYSAFVVSRMTFPNLFLNWHHFLIIEQTLILCVVGSTLMQFAGVKFTENKTQLSLALPTEMKNGRTFSIMLTYALLPCDIGTTQQRDKEFETREVADFPENRQQQPYLQESTRSLPSRGSDISKGIKSNDFDTPQKYSEKQPKAKGEYREFTKSEFPLTEEEMREQSVNLGKVLEKQLRHPENIGQQTSTGKDVIAPPSDTPQKNVLSGIKASEPRK